MKRFVRDGAPSRQARDGRRGATFSIRLTDDERERLGALRAELGGPRSDGAWLRWAALAGTTPPAEGTTRAARSVLPAPAMSVVLPELGAVLPVQVSGHLHGSTRSSGTWVTNPPLILDLCAGSGAWSAPYELGGYDVVRVTLPANDVRSWSLPKNRGRVWGVLAAPPCEAFSLAANGHKGIERSFAKALEVVCGCLRIIATVKPQWWALENPVGYLQRWLGTPRDVWEPYDFGDPWTKRTAVWGTFRIPERGPFVKPRGAGPHCVVCKGKRSEPRCSVAAHRAVTPPGFARAFFEANP